MSGAVTIHKVLAPAHAGKTFSKRDVEIVKTTNGDLYESAYRVEQAGTGAALRALLLGLAPDEVLTMGAPANGSVSGRLVTKARLPFSPGAITRCKTDWTYTDGPAWLTLDYDPPKGGEVLQPDQLKAALLLACSELTTAPCVHWHSASSFIFDGETQVRGTSGQRVYVLIASGADLQRAGKTLLQRLRLAGFGRVDVTASGALVERGLVDAAMWQPGRCDYIAGARCQDGISQRRPAPAVWSEGDALDTVLAIPPLSAEEESRHDASLAQDRDRAMPAALAARAAHRGAEVARRLPALMAAGLSAGEAETRIGAAVDAMYAGTLLGDAELTIVHPEGKREVVTVAQVLSQRDKYHEADCLDPINPSHRGGAADCRLFLLSASHIAFSLDDGGKVYRLRQQQTRLVVARGARSELVTRLAEAVAELDNVYRTDAGPVLLTGSRAVPLTPERLMNLVGGAVALFTVGAKGTEAPTDLPKETAQLVLASLY